MSVVSLYSVSWQRRVCIQQPLPYNVLYILLVSDRLRRKCEPYISSLIAIWFQGCLIVVAVVKIWTKAYAVTFWPQWPQCHLKFWIQIGYERCCVLWTSLWHAKLIPRTSSGHCMSIIISLIHLTNIGGLMQGWPISVILEKTAVSFCIEPSICCFTLPCIKLIFCGIILYYVMYVASSSISFASLLATSSDTEKYVKLYVQAMLMYRIVLLRNKTLELELHRCSNVYAKMCFYFLLSRAKYEILTQAKWRFELKINQLGKELLIHMSNGKRLAR